MGVEIENKANSVQLLLQLPTGTELGKSKRERCKENKKKPKVDLECVPAQPSLFLTKPKS